MYADEPKSRVIAPLDLRRFSTLGSSVKELALNVNSFPDNLKVVAGSL